MNAATIEPAGSASSRAEAELWRWLSTDAGEGLVGEAARIDPASSKQIERLRPRVPAGLYAVRAVSAALTLVDLRRRAEDKMPGLAARLLADRDGYEMASSERAARHAASRFAAVGGTAVDACCGIGVNAWAMAEAGLSAVAIDRDLARVEMARANTTGVGSCDLVHDDVQRDCPDGDLLFVDPMRRSAAGPSRRASLEGLEPGWPSIESLSDRFRGACIKLAPGIDRAVLPPNARVEWTSERGRMSQCLCWMGSLAWDNETVRATSLDLGATLEGEQDAGCGLIEPTALRAGDLVSAVDPAVERARLLGWLANETGGSVLADPGTGLLVGGEPSDWVRRFRLERAMRWDPRAAREAIAELGGGVVEVKTRGKLVDPDRTQIELRGAGDRLLTVFILRLGSEPWCLLTERVE